MSISVPKELKCPICGHISQAYPEHFEHWTRHYETGEIPKENIVPMDHDGAVRFYRTHPHMIEKGFRVIESEVWFFRGRIDLIGLDKSNSLVIVDVTSGKDEKRKIQQLQKYRQYIAWIGRHIYGLDFQVPMRLLIAKIGGEIKEVPLPKIEKPEKTFAPLRLRDINKGE